MASLRTTSGGGFVVCFRFGGRHFQRGLKTKDPAAAEAVRCRVIDRLYQLSIGSVTIPAGVDTGDFIVWGRTSMPESGNGAPKIEAGTILSVNAAIQRYLEEQRGLKADSTLGTERTHLNYLTVFLGARTDQSPQAAILRFLWASNDKAMFHLVRAQVQQRESGRPNVRALYLSCPG
jgi:hypothetical protein